MASNDNSYQSFRLREAPLAVDDKNQPIDDGLKSYAGRVCEVLNTYGLTAQTLAPRALEVRRGGKHIGYINAPGEGNPKSPAGIYLTVAPEAKAKPVSQGSDVTWEKVADALKELF